MLKALVLAAAVAALVRPALADTVRLEADPWCPHTCAAGPHPGYMVDIAREALALAGHRVEYRTVPWTRAKQDVRDGKADGAVGFLLAEAEGYGVHKVPLGRQGNAVVVRADDPFVFSGLESLRGRIIGSIQEYSYSTAIDGWLATHRAQVHALGGEDALERNLKKLLAGRVDVVVEDEAVLRGKLGGGVDRVRIAGHMAGGDLFIAFTPASARGEAFANALDAGIVQLRASGRLAQILAAYGLTDWAAPMPPGR